MKRPTSITVIAWILLISSLFSIAANFYNMSNPLVLEMMARGALPISAQFGMIFIGLVVTIVASIAMLKGREWSRKLYLGWSALAMLVSLGTSPMKVMLIPSFLVLALVAYFLYRPKANAYFLPQSETLAVANDA